MSSHTNTTSVHPLPIEGGVVVAKIKSVSQSGIFVTLPTHGDHLAYVSVDEISQRKTSSMSRHYQVDTLHTFRVLHVNKSGIDLTRKGVNEREAQKILSEYAITSGGSDTALVR
jgi:translation initiation factor 2 alpha subunit (eIF-2alpha)